jgi:1-acyl-sn-glycerol-3-phosphate acyltransferase
MTTPSLWLRSFAFNVGWYLGSHSHRDRRFAAAAGAAPLGRRLGAAVDCLRAVVAARDLPADPPDHGRENLPAGPVIIACKHQSSWETLAFTRLFDDIAIVLKRELLFIPVVGWAMARAGNIAVARGDGAAALRGLVRQGTAAVAEGRSIVIFPEGTRVAPGEQRPYHVGTAALYRQLGVPVVPMALNSGLFWGAANGSSGRASSPWKSCRRSRPACHGRLSWTPCASRSRGRRPLGQESLRKEQKKNSC